MDWISSGIGGIAGYASARETNNANREIAERANQYAQANAREQMQFQERMSNTEVQRRRADLKAAGINPLLAAKDGASAPSGASGGVSTATMTNPMTDAISAGSTAIEKIIQKQMAAAQLDNMGKQNELLGSQKKKTDMETFIMEKDAPKAELGSAAAKAIQSTITGAKQLWKEATDVNKAKTRQQNHRYPIVPLRYK